MMQSALAKDLVALLGRSAVSSDDADIRRYGGDALGVYRAYRAATRLNERASAVVWPKSVEDISNDAQIRHSQIRACCAIRWWNRSHGSCDIG